MVTANQKYTIDEKQKSNPNTTLQLILKSQEKRTKEGGKIKYLSKEIQNN